MKLWKKLSLMTVAVLFLATALSGTAVIFHSARYNEQKTLENYEEQIQSTALALGRELDSSAMEAYSSITKNAYLNYLVKKYGSDRYILLCEDEVICNLTPFELKKPEDSRWKGIEVKSVIQKAGKQYVLIAGRAVTVNRLGNYSLVLVRDISEVYADITRQAVLAGILYLGGAFLAVVLIFFFTGKMLAPLQSLQKAAEDIRCGRLDKRVRVHTKDEVGIVADAFNDMADRIEEQVTELSEISEQRKQMLGSLAHEMKTPMTSIIGYTDTLLHVNVKEAQRERALIHIYEESRRLERLGSKLMSLIGMYDNDSIRLEETELSCLFERAAQLEATNLARKEIRLQTVCHMGKRLLDQDLFESLLVNLIDNAVKASESGSTIYLTGKDNKITVRDEGCGIPKEEQKRVTEAFYMVDKARSRKAGGCGLGLSLCARIAKLHRAELLIESEEGKGTVVSIVFDADEAENIDGRKYAGCSCPYDGR